MRIKIRVTRIAARNWQGLFMVSQDKVRAPEQKTRRERRIEALREQRRAQKIYPQASADDVRQ